MRRDCRAGPLRSSRANTVACGVRTPSHPPDHTMGTRATSSALRRPCRSSTRRKAWSARMRVKSFTPPFPSVLPTTATTWSALNWPARIAASRPEASCTFFSSTFTTSVAIVWFPLDVKVSPRCRPRGSGWRVPVRQELARPADGPHDVLVAGAATEIARQPEPDLVVRRRGNVPQERERPTGESPACRTRTGARASRGTPAGSDGACPSAPSSPSTVVSSAPST